MKVWLFLLAFSVITLFLSPALAIAQTNSAGDDHTVREELEGKEVWEKLQAKQIECKDLTDSQYGSLGEYFMGQSIGNTERHAAMNQMMISMMGEEGEEQMHVAMGKRLSGCGPNAQVPSNGVGFMPMMPPLASLALLGRWMMSWGSFGVFGWFLMILFWVLLILGVVALVRYLTKSGSNKEDKTPLDILKERYVRGEINKKEFEEKKRDLS